MNMPYMHCLTSASLTQEIEDKLKAAFAQILADEAGKPESYLYVSLRGDETLFLGGKRKPGAVFQVSLVGTLNKTQKKAISARLAKAGEEFLGLSQDASYIIFQEVNGENWGWNGSTFG
jgi:phenylpyruvate tautomerase